MPPAEATPENKIRAALIRFLVLGGDKEHPVHELGVWLQGAWVEDQLDLECVRASAFLALVQCRIPKMMQATDAKLPGLNLEGSLLPEGLEAVRMDVRGSVFLRHGFRARAEVILLGARIGGHLDCKDGWFGGAPTPSRGALGEPHQMEQVPVALRAEGIDVKGDVFLTGVFLAKREVRLAGGRIGGNLTCTDGKFSVGMEDATLGNPSEAPAALNGDHLTVKGNIFLDGKFSAQGEVRLAGAQIEGSLHCSGGTFNAVKGRQALDAQRMAVKGKFELKPARFSGQINLSAARVGSLEDDVKCWPKDSLRLDGFHYDRISESRTDAEERIKWLEKQIPEHLCADFRPQPWEQLIKVLREMGHPAEASTIAIRKEKLWRRSGPKKKLLSRADWLKRLRNFFHTLYGFFARYGYRPTRTLICMVIAWVFCSLSYATAVRHGLFVPTAPAILVKNEEPGACGGPGKVSWTSPKCGKLPTEYPAFDPWVYSADLILPFVDLHQESNWEPITVTEARQSLGVGQLLRVLMWLEIIFGWAMSLLLLAALGRVLNRE